jgi:hypothetical protein
MIPGELIHYSDFEKVVNESHAGHGRSRLMAILFMRGDQEEAKKELIPAIEYFDHRSRDNIHFVLPGWSVDRVPGRSQAWRFCAKSFSLAADMFEEETKWKYDSGIQLIVCATALVSQNIESGIGFDEHKAVMVADLRSVIDFNFSDPAIRASPFLEDVIRFAKEYKGDNSLLEFVRKLRDAPIPKSDKQGAEYLKAIMIKDISKKPLINVISAIKEGKRI